MGLNVKRLRYALIAGAVLLVAVLAAYIGYGRYRAGKVWIDIFKKHAGVSLTRETDGYTYVQSVGDKVIYKLHAAKAIQHEDGKWILHDVIFTFYGRIQGGSDTIYGKDFEYNDKQGVAHALGEVQMDLQVPKSLATNGHAAQSPEHPDVIHVVTSGVTYVRELGVAATDQLVQFEYGGMKGSSVGAEFYNGQSVLHLLSKVVMDGELHNAPVHMTASRADLDRTQNIAEFQQPTFTSNGRTAKADHGFARFRQDGSMESAQATGAVTLTSSTQQIVAARLDATLNQQSLPQTAKLFGGVTLTDTSAVRPMHGSADTVDATFDAQGAPTKTIASGGASLSVVQHATNAPDLHREVSGQQIVATFAPGKMKGKSQLTELHAIGAARASGDSLTAAAKGPIQLKSTQLAADDLRATFAPQADGHEQLQKLFGGGHTQIHQTAPMGEEQTSSGDSLEVAFEPLAKPSARADASVQIATAVQTGHVVIESRAAQKPGSNKAATVTNASADRAIYSNALQRLVLSGNAHLNDGTTELSSATVALDQTTGDAEAQGNVLATLFSTQPSQPTQQPAQPTHVMAASARLQHDAKKAEFHGTDAQPARMWQGASQVAAATLYLDGDKRTMSARPVVPTGLIHAVFASQSASPNSAAKPSTLATPKSPSNSVVRIASQKMDFSDLQHEATFSGAVRIDGTMGDVRAQRTVVFLQPAPKTASPRGEAPPTPFAGTGGSLDRIVISGDVQLEEPGRHGTGEQLLYTAATDNYVLTGTSTKQPKIIDEKQGTVTGATLIFGDAGSTIIVAGEPASSKSSGTRVRTETGPQK